MKSEKNLSLNISRIERPYLTINNEYQELLESAPFHSFESIWNFSNGETIKQIKARSVIRFEIRHHDIKRTFYIKRHNSEFIGLSRLFSRLFSRRSLSQGRLEFENICDFRKYNLPTVVPVVAGEKFSHFFWTKSFLITEDFSPFISLEALLENQPQFFLGPKGENRKHILLKEVAVLARIMHQNGFNHRDFNATHILLNYNNESDIPQIALFDLQRVEKRKYFRFRWKIKSIARLNYTLPDDIFNIKDRIYILLSYKDKKSFNFLDRMQWFWIERKTAKIKRHTEKMIYRKAERVKKRLLEK
jgi:heptose I phosphotransferase